MGTTHTSAGFLTGFRLVDNVYTPIHVTGTLETAPFGVNASGRIVGQYRASGVESPQAYHAFVMNGGSVQTIDPPGAYGHSAALGINDSGQVVGSFASGPGVGHGFLLSGANYTQIDVPGASATFAYGINSAGEIAGTYVDRSAGWHGFVLSGGRLMAIDVPGATHTWVRGINDVGRIVGYFEMAGQIHGFLATRGGSAPPPPAPLYDVTDLGAFDAYGITESSQVVGVAGYQAVLWRRGTGVEQLSTPGGWVYGRAFGAQDVQVRRGDVVFNATVVAGEAESTNGNGNSNSPFGWLFRGRPGSPAAISGVPDFAWGPFTLAPHRARAVNGGGVVVGSRGGRSYCTGPPSNLCNAYVLSEAFKYSMAAAVPEMMPLATPNGDQGVAAGLNGFGDVVGWYVALAGSDREPGSRTHAIVWHDSGAVRDLGGLGGASRSSRANGISDSGLIVGVSTMVGGVSHATAWLPDGDIRDLGTLGGANSEALAVNRSNVVVGWADSLLGRRAFVASGAAEMVDLNSVISQTEGWSLTVARGINSAGSIVGVGFKDGQQRAFLLTLRQGTP